MRISTYFKGRNMMTPEVIDYGEIEGRNSKRIFFEISTGTGFLSNEPIFGLTFVSVDKDGIINRSPEGYTSQMYSNMVDLDISLSNLGVKYYGQFVKVEA